MDDEPNPLRKALWPLATLYATAVALRNLPFNRGWRRVHSLEVPVVSVGNLAAGGTGKTPLICWLVARALAQGRRPGVLARGYGRAPGAELNDEGMLLERRFPGLPQAQDPDRVAAGQRLLAQAEVDLLLLDDGFQHRRLHRDRDIVCLDMARPLAGGFLPVGLLREGLGALRRASMVVLTRAGGFDSEAIDWRRQELRRWVPEATPIYAAEHRPTRLLCTETETEVPATDLAGRRVLLLSGIARPQSFAATVRSLGAEVLAEIRRPDHHRHTAAELAAASARAAALDAELLVTEKDEVKLRGLPQPRLVLLLDLQMCGDEPTVEECFPPVPHP